MKLIHAILVAVAVHLPALSVVACAPPSSPETVKAEGTIAQGACNAVVAFVGTPGEQALCASAPELIDLANDIRAARADAAPPAKFARLAPSSGKCQIIDTICATDDELAQAFPLIRASRAGGAK